MPIEEGKSAPLFTLPDQDGQPQSLADQFGGHIVFHGGVDTQGVLPFGTPDEVALHARETVEKLGQKGGYIFGPSQILGPDIPVENIVAMYEAV